MRSSPQGSRRVNSVDRSPGQVHQLSSSDEKIALFRAFSRARGRVSTSIREPENPAPWTAPPSRRRKELPVAGNLPQSLELVLGNEIYVTKDGAGAAKPVAACRGIPESRVLQSAGYESADLREATHHRLRRGKSPSHRPAARLPGGCSS